MQAQQTLTNQTIVQYDFEGNTAATIGAGASAFLNMGTLPVLGYDNFTGNNSTRAVIIPKNNTPGDDGPTAYSTHLHFNPSGLPMYLVANYSNLVLKVRARVNQGNGSGNGNASAILRVSVAPDGQNFGADIAQLTLSALPQDLNIPLNFAGIFNDPQTIIRLAFATFHNNGVLVDKVSITGDITLPAEGATIYKGADGWEASQTPLFNSGTAIGIGTISPLTLLDVSGFARCTRLSINSGVPTKALEVRGDATVSNSISIGAGQPLGTERLLVNGSAVVQNGSLSIGANQPLSNELLYVNGSTTINGKIVVNSSTHLKGESLTDGTAVFRNVLLSQRTVNQPFTYNMITEVLGDNEENRNRTVALLVKNNGTNRLHIFCDGSIATEGKICAQRFNATLNGVNCWPDYVFEADYALTPLARLKAYITENKHLPDIPSAQEVVDNGHDIGDMNIKLLQKVEELTLYILQLEERLQKLETHNPNAQPENNR